MKKVLNTVHVSAEQNNQAIDEGYLYAVCGDVRFEENNDGWSREPYSVYGKTVFFTDLKEAEKYAKTQKGIANRSKSAIVITLEREETEAEKRAKREKERAEAKTKREAREIEKANALGMTLEKYKIYKNKNAQIARHENAIERLREYLKEETERINAEIAENEAWLKENT